MFIGCLALSLDKIGGDSEEKTSKLVLFSSRLALSLHRKRETMKSICNFITRYMGIFVLFTALISLSFPELLNRISTSTINPLLGVIMFGMGLTLSTEDFKVVYQRPIDLILGCLAQFTLMPLLALFLVKLFHLSEGLAIGVILVGCCPGGTASNVITYLAKGDVALSVGMTAVSTILAPIVTPLLVWLLAGTLTKVDTIGMLLSIVYVIIAPVLCGLICRKHLPEITRKVTDYLPAFSSLMIMFVVGIIVSHNADKLLSGGLIIILIVILHNLGGLAMGLLIGRMLRLPRAKYVAISIEVGMQNSGLASSLAVMHYAAFPLAAIPGAIFSVWHNISGSIMARIYARDTAR